MVPEAGSASHSLSGIPGGTGYHAFLYGPVLLGTRIEDPSLEPAVFHQPTKVLINKRAEGITSPELTAPAGEVVASAERFAGDKKLRFQVPASVATREFSLEPYNGIHFLPLFNLFQGLF